MCMHKKQLSSNLNDIKKDVNYYYYKHSGHCKWLLVFPPLFTIQILRQVNDRYTPVSPAPATPNREPMIATPAADPRAAAPAPPIKAPAPAATKGAASPPVSPAVETSAVREEHVGDSDFMWLPHDWRKGTHLCTVSPTAIRNISIHVLACSHLFQKQLCMYKHTHTHTHTHKHTHAHTHTYMNTMHTHTHTHAHTHTHNAHTHTHTCTQCTRAHTHKHTHHNRPKHTHSHTQTHTIIHTLYLWVCHQSQ